jgi:anti-sigma factor (TIGR02949 family)
MSRHVSCEEVIARLFEFLDHEVDPNTEQEFERHLEACRACFSRAEFERRLRAKVAEAATARAPDALRMRVRMITARF